MVYRTEMMKDVIAKRENPHLMRDPWDDEARERAEQWIRQAHERGQNDLHI